MKTNSLSDLQIVLQMSFSQHSCFRLASVKVQIGSQYFGNNFPVINVILRKIDMQLESLLKSSHRKDTLASSTTCQTTKRGGRRREMDGNKFSFYEF